MFPDYPYADGHQLNLDWLVTNLTELKEALDTGQLVGPAGENGESAFIDSIVMQYAFVPYNTTPLPTVWFNTVGLAEAAYGRDIAGAILCTKIRVNCHTGDTYYSHVVHSRTYQGKDGEVNITDVQNAVDDYLTTHPTVTGTFTNAAKYALLALLEKVAYIDEHGQEYLDTLETELFTMAVASISAVFNPGTNVIYTDNTLDSLKQYLTVTATYLDSSTEVLADSVYTLSGTLAAGTNTITVSYGGKTTTFTVTVVAPLYSLPNVAQHTVTASGQGTGVISITDGLVSYSGNFGNVVYIDKNGNVSTTRPTSEWFTLTQGAEFLFEAYDLTWTNGGTARTFHAKWCRSTQDGNVYTAVKEFAANSIGEDETAQFTSAGLLSGPVMSGFVVQLNNGNANSTTVSFRIRMFVDGVRYF